MEGEKLFSRWQESIKIMWNLLFYFSEPSSCLCPAPWPHSWVKYMTSLLVMAWPFRDYSGKKLVPFLENRLCTRHSTGDSDLIYCRQLENKPASWCHDWWGHWGSRVLVQGWESDPGCLDFRARLHLSCLLSHLTYAQANCLPGFSQPKEKSRMRLLSGVQLVEHLTWSQKIWACG